MTPRMSYTNKYYGEFSNKEGKITEAYMVWNSERGGFQIKSAVTGRTLIPGVFDSLIDLRSKGYSFKTDGHVEPNVVEEREAVAA